MEHHKSFDPIKNINSFIFSHNVKKINDGINSTISYCKILLTEIKEKKNASANQNRFVSRAIIDHMYIVYYCFKCIGILKVGQFDIQHSTVINNADQKMIAYLESFFSSKDIYDIFLMLKKQSNDDDEIVYFSHMLEKCTKHQKHPELQKEIKNLENEINDNLNQEEQLPYGLLEKLVVLRHKYANRMGCETFFNLMIGKNRQITADEIFQLINDHIVKIDSRSKKEITRIHKQIGKNRKVEMHDFIQCRETLSSQQLFSLKHVLDVIFTIVEKYFGIMFAEIDEHSLWSEKVYKLYDKNENLGYLHMDLIQNANKKITQPICIHLSQEYSDINDLKYDTHICLLAGYKNYDDENMKYTDVVALFKEIGMVLQFSMYKTKTGNVICADEFYLLTSKIMEHIFWERSTLVQLCSFIDEAVRKQTIDLLISSRYIDFAHSVKMRCINAYFDLLIHSSKSLGATLQRPYCNGETYTGNIIREVYKNIYSNVMSSQKYIYETNIEAIPPIAIIQEINGAESKVYESVVIEILSYGVFAAIKNKHGKKYMKILSNAHNPNFFKQQLDKFVKKFGDNYSLYLQSASGEN